MHVNFEELDYQRTAIGELILRRRRALEVDGREIFEVKLNDEYLMSSLFHEGEVALTDLGLVELASHLMRGGGLVSLEPLGALGQRAVSQGDAPAGNCFTGSRPPLWTMKSMTARLDRMICTRF